MGAAATAASVLVAGPASAASWWGDPNSCSGAKTVVSKVVNNRTVEVRAGSCGGSQHGWGRIVGYGSGDYIRFEVDTNGDRVQDGASWYLATNRNYTAGYPTASGSTRAFRACFVTSSTATCTSTNSTAWW
ncbi:hypothetical protein ACFCYB_33060 [Streptomyces sp. NPDC056309]|uniref:hypothetical protein n=1 Tax=unclassified Streptomyces TaxID=2593676 RepID=UPI0035E27405